jgi:hypothetical protein
VYPPALQLPADAHDTEVIAESPVRCGLPHRPLVSLTTNPRLCPPASVYNPPAPQLPTDGHDTEVIPENAESPMACGLPQRPFVSLTTNAPGVGLKVPPQQNPPAPQLPARGHDTGLRDVSISFTVPQRPFVSGSANPAV